MTERAPCAKVVPMQPNKARIAQLQRFAAAAGLAVVAIGAVAMSG